MRANSKDPLEQGWTNAATVDAQQITRWWVDPVMRVERDHNIGVLTSGLVVVDLDVKQGRRGIESFFGLGLEFDTLTVRTPTGGYHVYYSGQDTALAVDLLGKGSGVDVRSHNGYVVAPGSTIDGLAYTVEIDAPMSIVPTVLMSYLRAPGKRAERVSSDALEDAPEAMAAAAHWLRFNAPLAVEGEGGDQTTFAVAARVVRQFVLSPETACELLLEHWNDRCDPPWDADELLAKCENAENYATGAIGSDHPETHFGGVDLPTAAPIIPTVPQGVFTFGNMVPVGQQRARPWALEKILLLRSVTAVVAAGASGKSTLNLLLAAHLALGLDFGPFKNKLGRPVKSVVYNAEDDREEMSKRLSAVCKLYGFDEALVASRVCLVSGEDLALMLTQNSPPVINAEHVAELIKACSDPEVAALFLDPLVEIHSAEEDDNVAMRYVMGVLRLIAQQANVAVVISHHTRKPANASAASYAGDINSGRGAGAIAAAARIGLTLYGMSETDAEQYGVREDQRDLYSRMDGAKMNLSRRGGGPLWLKFQGVPLPCGDEIGVPMFHDMQADARGTAKALARMLAASMRAQHCASLPLLAAVEVLRAADPLLGKQAAVKVKEQVERFLTGPVELEDGTRVRLEKTDVGGKKLATVIVD